MEWGMKFGNNARIRTCYTCQERVPQPKASNLIHLTRKSSLTHCFIPHPSTLAKALLQESCIENCLCDNLSFLATAHVCAGREGKSSCSLLIYGSWLNCPIKQISKSTNPRGVKNKCFNEMWWKVSDHGEMWWFVSTLQQRSSSFKYCFSKWKRPQAAIDPDVGNPAFISLFLLLRFLSQRLSFLLPIIIMNEEKMDQNGASSYSRFRHGLSLRACFND